MYTTFLAAALFVLASWIMIAYRVGRPGDRTMFAPLCGPNPNILVMRLTTIASFMAFIAMIGTMRVSVQLTILIPLASLVIVAAIWHYYDFRYNLMGRAEDIPDLREPFEPPRKNR